jgi:hypothetical protein
MNCKGGWRGEGGVAHRLGIGRKDIRCYAKRRRFVALVRVLWLTQVGRHYGEACEVCGRDYVLWVATTTLYEAVMGKRSGQICPRCFTIRSMDVLGRPLAWEPFDSRDNERFDAIFSTGLGAEGTEQK